MFAIIIIMAAFLPIFTFEGVAGKLFRPLVFTMNFYLVGAIVSALFIIPSLIRFFLTRRPLTHRESPVIKLAHWIYKPLLHWSLRHAKLVLLGALVSLGLAYFIGTHVGSEFLPALDEGNIWLRVTVLPTSVSLEEAVKTAHRLRQILAKFPEVKNVTSQTGCPDDGTDPNLFSNVEIFLDLKPSADWRPEFHGNKAELVKALNKVVSVVPNALFYFSQYIQDNVDEAVAGAKGTLAIKIFGPDIEVLQKLGDKVTNICSSVPGLVDVANSQQIGQPQYQIAIDRDEASRYGVNVSDVQSLVETGVGGKVATRLIDGERRFPVLVRLSREYRNSVAALTNILIDPPGPISAVPLSQMASIKYGYGAAFITREANSRVMIVRINLRDRDLGSAVQEAQRKIAAELKLPEGYKLVWAGQYQFQQEANQRLMLIVPLTLLLIYILLMCAFSSHKHSLLILCAVPLAALGAVSALLITHTYFSISAAVGFIALSGVAVQNGVILISHINHLRKEHSLTVIDAAYQGAVDRMRPVLMTATVAMLGLLPAATSNGIGAQSQKPFAIAIIGGLMTATALTLVVLPALYTMIEKDTKKDKDMAKPDQTPKLDEMPTHPEGVGAHDARMTAPHPIVEVDETTSADGGKSADGINNADNAIKQEPPTKPDKGIDGITPLIGLLLLAGSTLSGCTPSAMPSSNSSPEPAPHAVASIPADSKSDFRPAVATQGPVVVTLNDDQKREINLQIAEVKKGEIHKTVESTGRVGPNAELSTLVSTPSAGRAVEVKARLGDMVKPGQIMAIIKSDPIGQVQSDMLQNALQARADIIQQEVALKLSHITYEREKKLWTEQVSAKADLQAAENQLEKDEANLTALKAKLDAIVTTARGAPHPARGAA